jgi:hypothetical protein
MMDSDIVYNFAGAFGLLVQDCKSVTEMSSVLVEVETGVGVSVIG